MSELETAPRYERRNEIEEARNPDVIRLFALLARELQHGLLPPQLKSEIFTIASLTSGCRHCQSHGAHGLHQRGASLERIHALWDFEQSALFTDAEKAAYRLARDASIVPNAVTAAHFAELRRYWSDAEIAELVVDLCRAAWMNRWSDTIAVVTDQPSVAWATENLAAVGWSVGKHAPNDPSEQRQGLMWVLPEDPKSGRRVSHGQNQPAPREP